MRQDYAAARADGDDRERLCLDPGNRTLARRVPSRDERLPERQPRRPGRLDRSVPRLVPKTDEKLGALRALPTKIPRTPKADEENNDLGEGPATAGQHGRGLVSRSPTGLQNTRGWHVRYPRRKCGGFDRRWLDQNRR